MSDELSVEQRDEHIWQVTNIPTQVYAPLEVTLMSADRKHLFVCERVNSFVCVGEHDVQFIVLISVL